MVSMRHKIYGLKIALCLLVLAVVFSAPPFVSSIGYENDTARINLDSPQAAFLGPLDAHLRGKDGKLLANARMLLLSGFFMVHGSIVAFAWAAHTLPASFRFEILAGTGLSLRSPASAAAYAGIASLLVLIDWNTFRRLRSAT